MHSATFEGTVLAGHQDAAVEVPFDPTVRWNLPMTRFQAGRWGHPVEAHVNDLRFETAIVPRANSYFLLLPAEFLRASGLEVGATLRITVQVRPASSTASAGGGRPPAPRRARRGRATKE